MPLDPLRRSVLRPHGNLSPWIGGGLLAAGGLAALVAIALTPVRSEPPRSEPVAVPVHVPMVATPDPAPVAAPPCDVPDEGEVDLARWTIGPDHFGPLVACRPVTVESVRALLPGYTVSSEPFVEDERLSFIVVARHGRPVLRIRPQWDHDGEPPSIEVEVMAPVVTTPWGIRVGDRVRELRAHHPDLVCSYGAAEGDEQLYCGRRPDPYGWNDSLRYHLRLADLSTDEHYAVSLAIDDIDLQQIAKVRIASITWQSGQ